MRKHLSYSNIVASLALFLVLGGGTAIAARAIITKPSQLRNGVVTNKKVKRGTLSANRLSAKARAALKGNIGPRGLAGPQGPQGPQGPSGSPLAAPGASAVATSAQNIPTAGAGAQVRLDNEVFDTGSMYSPPDDGLSVSRPGTYLITGFVNWSQDPGGGRRIRLLVGGASVGTTSAAPALEEGTGMQAVAVARVSNGQQITMIARQTSGAPLETQLMTGLGYAGLTAQWLSP